MAATLVGDLTGLFQSQALGEAAAQLGESEGSVLRGFQAASATIVSGLASKVSQGGGFLKQAFDLISMSDGSLLDNVRSWFSRVPGASSDGPGGQFLSMLFGDAQPQVTEKISQASGLRPTSAAKLMSFAAPLVLGALGKRVKEGHLDMPSFSNLLQQEGSGISSMVPTGLTNLWGAPAATKQVFSSVAEPPSRRWLWPLAALLVVAGLVWLFTRGRSQVSQSAGQATSQIRSTTDSVANFFRTTLVNGIELNIPSGGMEARLLEFIKTAGPATDLSTWFEFDRLRFNTNSATLSTDSQEQLGNIAAILKAYPNLRVKIGGYTDNTGDPGANLRLSQLRAESVRQQLASSGIAAERLEAEGYGDQHPVADNSTEEGRARNRRIAMRITQMG